MTRVQFYCSAMYTLQLLCIVSICLFFLFYFSNNLIKSYMPAYIFAVLICIYTVITMKTRCSFTKFKGLLLTFIFLFQWFALKQKNVRGEDCIVTQPWWSLHCREMHWLIQPFAQTPLNQICRVFTLSFKTHSNTHTHARIHTQTHNILSSKKLQCTPIKSGWSWMRKYVCDRWSQWTWTLVFFLGSKCL